MLHKEPKKPDAAALSRSESPAPQPDDALTQELRASVRRQRRRHHVKTLLTGLLVLGLIGLAVWLVWPRHPALELMVIGFDHVTGMGKPVKIRAATAPRDNAVQQWGGRELFFQEIAPPLAKADKPTASRTDERGLAELPWTLKHATPVAEIEAVYIDEAMRPPWTDRARSRVFSWPTASRVLLLDVEPTLKNAANWAELAKALRNAEANGWHIVYLALKEDAPLEYKKVRNWVLTQTTASEHALVNGPVLGRLHLAAGESEPTARKAVLATLKAEFTGAIVFVSGEQGLQLRNIATAGDWAGEPVSLAGWQELPDKLAK